MGSLFNSHPVVVIFSSLLVLLLAERAWHALDKFGVFRESSQIHPGTCKVLEGNYRGSEDMAKGPHDTVIASTGGLSSLKNAAPDLYVGDKLIQIDGLKVKDISLGKEFGHIEFVPHGIDLKQVDENNWLIFVVNHRSDQDYVEMFDWDLSKGLVLKHYKSVGVSEMEINGNINDVTVVSRDSFYATNDKFMGATVGRVSHLTGFPACKVVFWDNGKVKEISRWHIEPNGIAVSGDRLFFSDPMANKLYEFKGKVETGDVELVNTISVATAPDNIEVLSQNELLVGCHITLYKLFPYFKDPKNLISPSHIIRVWRKDVDSAWQVENLFMDDGSLVSGSSVGIYGKNREILYIGTVSDKIAYCKAK